MSIEEPTEKRKLSEEDIATLVEFFTLLAEIDKRVNKDESGSTGANS